jgi:hypothetical protein
MFIFFSMAVFLLVIAAITSTCNFQGKRPGKELVYASLALAPVDCPIHDRDVCTYHYIIVHRTGNHGHGFPYFNTITGKDFDISRPSKNIATCLVDPPQLSLFLREAIPFYLAGLKPVTSLKSGRHTQAIR